MLSLIVAAASLSLGTICDNSKASRSDVEKHIVTEILPSEEKRTALENALKGGGAKQCRELLVDFLASVQKKKERAEWGPARSGLLNLSANGGIPGAIEIIEKEIASGKSDDNLDALKRASESRYRDALRVWLRDTAKQTRKALGFEKGDARLYGVTAISDDRDARDTVRIISPLFLERFLTSFDNKQERPSDADLADLNVIFAGTPAGHREVFLPLYRKALRAGISDWIVSFRKENVSVQARLFPIFEAIGGPEVVRELMWLTQNHSDQRIRSIADRTLDKVLSNPKPLQPSKASKKVYFENTNTVSEKSAFEKD